MRTLHCRVSGRAALFSCLQRRVCETTRAGIEPQLRRAASVCVLNLRWMKTIDDSHRECAAKRPVSCAARTTKSFGRGFRHQSGHFKPVAAAERGAFRRPSRIGAHPSNRLTRKLCASGEGKAAASAGPPRRKSAARDPETAKTTIGETASASPRI